MFHFKPNVLGFENVKCQCPNTVASIAIIQDVVTSIMCLNLELNPKDTSPWELVELLEKSAKKTYFSFLKEMSTSSLLLLLLR